VAIGHNVSSTADGAILFGSGVDDDNPLINNTVNSLAIGFSSTTATLIVADSSSVFSGNLQVDDYLFVDSTNEAVIIGSSSPEYTYPLIAYGSSTNPDVEMFWNADYGAFRAGYRYGTYWDDANTGEYSMAFGYRTKASGAQSAAFGHRTTASGDYSMAAGVLSTASGGGSLALGNFATASASYTVAIGQISKALGSYSVAIGGEHGTATGNYGATIGGQYNRAGDNSGDSAAIAMGSYADALNAYSITFGHWASTTADNAITFGSGADHDNPLVNSTANSLAVGFGSTTATLAVQDYQTTMEGNASVTADLTVGGTLWGGSPLDIGSAVSSSKDLSVDTTIYAPEICLAGDCQSSWGGATATDQFWYPTDDGTGMYASTTLPTTYATTSEVDHLIVNTPTTLGVLTIPDSLDCDASERGQIGRTEGATSESDKIYACLKTAGGAGQWQNTYDAGEGIRTIRTLGDNVFIGLADGDVYYASNTSAGTEWIFAFDAGGGINDFCSTTQAFFAVVNDGSNNGKVWISTDQGESWSLDESITGYRPLSCAEVGTEGASEVYFGLYDRVTPKVARVLARNNFGAYSGTNFAKGDFEVRGCYRSVAGEVFCATGGGGAIYKKASVIAAWVEHFDYSDSSDDRVYGISEDSTNMYATGGNSGGGTFYTSSSAAGWFQVSNIYSSSYTGFMGSEDFGDAVYISTYGGAGGDILKYISSTNDWSIDLNSGQIVMAKPALNDNGIVSATRGSVGVGLVYRLAAGLEGYKWTKLGEGGMFGGSFNLPVEEKRFNWNYVWGAIVGILLIRYIIIKYKIYEN